MSRSGYSDDCDNLGLWLGAVQRATTGYRGQHFLKKLLAALDALPTKRLITDAIKNEQGEVCALGALDPNIETYYSEELAAHFGIARALAAEIVYQNDEFDNWRLHKETPEQRYKRMRAWVASRIVAEETPDAVDPSDGSEGTPSTREKTSDV